MNKLYILLALLAFAACKSKKTDQAPSEQISDARVLFYNVENLFDTLNTEGKRDGEFTPEGDKQWNSERYFDKLNKLAKVIAAADSGYLPDIIGLAEIENRAVVEDLAKTAPLKGYKVIHQESPDQRGIDVALMYRSGYEPLHNEYILVDLGGERSHTRDILYSKGVFYKDTVHLFVNHWPSRYGGKEKSDPKRAIAAQKLRSKVDSLFAINSGSRIIIMGDFNDYPADKSLSSILGAKEEASEEAATLINLAWKFENSGQGSYNYRGNWGCLDQFIISSALMKGPHLEANMNSYSTVYKDWLIYTNDKGEKYPSRSYGGPNYYGGYSDHLAIQLKLKVTP